MSLYINILIFLTFMAKFQFLPVFYCKSAILEVDHVCGVIMMSYVGCLYLFWYVWKEEIQSYTEVYQLDVSEGSLFKFTGMVTTPFSEWPPFQQSQFGRLLHTEEKNNSAVHHNWSPADKCIISIFWDINKIGGGVLLSPKLLSGCACRTLKIWLSL